MINVFEALVVGFFAAMLLVVISLKIGGDNVEISNLQVKDAKEKCKNNGDLEFITYNKIKCKNQALFDLKERKK